MTIVYTGEYTGSLPSLFDDWEDMGQSLVGWLLDATEERERPAGMGSVTSDASFTVTEAGQSENLHSVRVRLELRGKPDGPAQRVARAYKSWMASLESPPPLGIADMPGVWSADTQIVTRAEISHSFQNYTSGDGYSEYPTHPAHIRLSPRTTKISVTDGDSERSLYIEIDDGNLRIDFAHSDHKEEGQWRYGDATAFVKFTPGGDLKVRPTMERRPSATIQKPN